MAIGTIDVAENLKALDTRLAALETQTMPITEFNFQLRDLDTRLKQHQEQLKLLESTVLEMFRDKGNGSKQKSQPSNGQTLLGEEDGIEMINISSLSGGRLLPDADRRSSNSNVSIPCRSPLSYNSMSIFAFGLRFKTDDSTLPESPYESIVFYPQESRKAGITIIASIAFSFMLQFVLLNSFWIMNWSKLRSVRPDDARNWRNGAGHRDVYMSVLTGSSLVSRVCAGDASLHMSGDMMQRVETIRAFLLPGASSLWSFAFGGMLGVVVSIVWSMQAGQELATVFNYLFCLLTLPGGSTKIQENNDDNEKMHILSIGSHMRCIAVFACCVHLAIDVAAWYLGCTYIVRTIDVENVVINGLGAALMISVDKVVYNTFLADQVKKHIEQFRFHGYRGTCANKLFFMALMPVAMILIELLPLTNDMNDYLDEACGGEQNFLIGVAHYSHIFAASPSPPANAMKRWSAPNDSEPDPFGFGHFKYVVKSAVGTKKKQAVDETELSGKQLFWLPNVRSLKLFLNMELADFRNEISPLCHDFDLLQLPAQFLGSLRRQVGAPLAKSCKDFAQFRFESVPACHIKSNRLLRAFCPFSCGCDEPASGLLYTSGCPNACSFWRSLKAKTHNLLQHTQGGEGLCNNFVPETLVKNANWSLYVSSIRFKWKQFFYRYPCYQEGLTQHLPALDRGECPVSKMSALWDTARTFCSNPGFAFWCPESCKCKRDCSGESRWRCNPDCNPVCATNEG